MGWASIRPICLRFSRHLFKVGVNKVGVKTRNTVLVLDTHTKITKVNLSVFVLKSGGKFHVTAC